MMLSLSSSAGTIIKNTPLADGTALGTETPEYWLPAQRLASARQQSILIRRWRAFILHWWLLPILCAFSAAANAIDDERVIKHMARHTSLSVEQIRADYRSGCESGNTSSMTICASFHFFAADLELNDTYRQLMKQLTTKSARDKLAKAQRAWVIFRDITCEYESEGWSGVSGQGMSYLSCKQAVTETRTSQLGAYLACMSPGCPGEW